MDFQRKKYDTSKRECQKHIERLNHAVKKTNHLFPLNPESFESLNDDQIAYIDQIIYRFSKLQDSMGQRLMDSGLNLIGEVDTKDTMIDKLLTLEKLMVIENKQTWLELRELRNQLTHEYPKEHAMQFEALNGLFENIPFLVSVYHNLTEFIDSKLTL